jgi:hypothetical protein
MALCSGGQLYCLPFETPKLYFYDMGLVSWLLGIDAPAQIVTHPLYGSLFETWVVGELLKARLNRAQEPRISFWQDRSGHEIDVIAEWAGSAIPVEIKAGQTVASDFFKGLDLWRTLSGESSEKGWLIYGGSAHQERARWHVVPWSGSGISPKRSDRLPIFMFFRKTDNDHDRFSSRLGGEKKRDDRLWTFIMIADKDATCVLLPSQGSPDMGEKSYVIRSPMRSIVMSADG